MSVMWMLLVSFASGCGHIVCDYKKHYPLIYALKPLTVLLIISAVVVYSSLDAYALCILAGLCFSLLGDIFLMLRKRKFIPGLISFLVAHLLYSYGFYLQLDGSPMHWLYLVYFSLIALIYYGYLYSGLGKLKTPVLFYVSAIVSMAFLSLEVYLSSNNVYALSAFIGAIIFMISDGALALNKFRLPFNAAQLVILSTYYVAQWAIAYSTF